MGNTKKDVEQETVVEQPVAEKKAYKFVSANKFLTVDSLKVQFINGKAEVEDITVARALATIDGVELIEE